MITCVTSLHGVISLHKCNMFTTFILFLGLQFLVIQQPLNTPGYVSRLDGTVTQFQQAEGHGFLAHNYAAGRHFFELTTGEEITFDDKTFHVAEIKQYQAIEPNNAKSDFIDLETGEKLTARELFNLIYTNPDALVLQTCIEKEGIDSWGRLFVIAE